MLHLERKSKSASRGLSGLDKKIGIMPFCVRMKTLMLMVTVSLCPGWGRLVVEKEEDLYLEDGETLDQYMIVSQADKISVTLRKSEDCPEVEEEEQIYEYFVMVDGKEERRELEAVMVIDLQNITRTVRNALEPWVVDEVTLRLVMVICSHLKVPMYRKVIGPCQESFFSECYGFAKSFSHCQVV